MKKYIGTPINGWEERTWYLVEVAYSPNNVIHRAMFFSGFLNGEENSPGGYNGFVSIGGFYEEFLELSDAYYLKVLKKIFSEKDLDMIELVKTPCML